MTRNITHQNEPIAQAGGIGAGFLLVAGTILASGLALFGAASWLGVQAEIQRGLLRGVLTAAAG